MKRLFKKDSRLYLITDTGISGLPHTEIARKAVSAGIRIIQIRDKSLSKRAIYKDAVIVRSLTQKNNVALIINDHIDIALAVDADGVHLGQDDMPVEEARKMLGNHKIIGISTHTLKQALDAESSGADYIGFGPVFMTSTKNAGRPRGIKSLLKIRNSVDIPVVAIGGINPDNAKEVLHGGADAVAAASAILYGDIAKNIEKFLAIT